MTGVAQVEIARQIRQNGHIEILRDSAQKRLLVPQEIRLLVDRSEAFRLIGWYGDFDLNQPLDNSAASTRMVTALQKTQMI